MSTIRSLCCFLRSGRRTRQLTICVSGLVQNVEKLEGRLLSDEMDAFVCAFCGATGSTNYAGVMALLSVIGNFQCHKIRKEPLGSELLAGC